MWKELQPFSGEWTPTAIKQGYGTAGLPLSFQFIPFYSCYTCLYTIAWCGYMPCTCVMVLVGNCGRFDSEMVLLMETVSEM